MTYSLLTLNKFTVRIGYSGADECTTGHDGYPLSDAAVVFVERTDKVHVATNEDQLLGKF